VNSLSYRCTCAGWKMAILPSNSAPPLGIKVRHFTVTTAECAKNNDIEPVAGLQAVVGRWPEGMSYREVHSNFTKPKRFRCVVDHIDFQCITPVWVPEDEVVVRRGPHGY